MIERLKCLYRANRFRYKIDPDEINFIIAHLKKGDIAVDLGAHKGGYLYWMQKKVGNEGKVFGFEPQVKLFNYLKNLKATFSWNHVQLENMGVSAKEGEVDFFIPKTEKGDSPGARIDFVEDGLEYEASKIKITTLDQYFLDRQIFPNLIKIDVEGHEKQVLLGGINLLKTHKPVILMECENRHLEGESVFDVFDVLLEIGYEGFFFESGKLKPIKEFSLEKNQKIGAGRFWEAEGYVNNFVFRESA